MDMPVAAHITKNNTQVQADTWEKTDSKIVPVMPISGVKVINNATVQLIFLLSLNLFPHGFNPIENYNIPNSNLADSDIIERSQGGSKTNSTSTDSTSSKEDTARLISSAITGPIPQPGAVKVIVISI